MPEKVQKTKNLIGEIKPREIVQEMKDSYIDYAMSVIVSRALPDVRDGLKPVQRKILYTMYEMGLKANARFRKSATVVGETMGKFHPHGDAAIYAALMRMAQDFSLRYPLAKGQGNVGSGDDPPAHMRYTEAKLSKVGEELLQDIEKNTVDFRYNFDNTRKEPKVLPSPVPNLLLNGCLGIAVGMATSIPPHNLNEVCDAAVYFVDHPKATTQELFTFINGPDFPTGGIVYNKDAIIAAYSQGKGPIVIKGKAEIVRPPTLRQGGGQIIISEIPFGVRKSGLIQQIAKLVQDKKIKGIKDMRDESDQQGMRIVIDLKAGALGKRILNYLYKATSLQTTFHLNMIALVDGIQPKVLSLPEILEYFIEHRKQVVIRRTQFDLKKAQARAHILEGLDKALKKIDAVIKTIKASKNREEAQKNLVKKFKLTQIQANAILEMKLSSLARLERQKIAGQLQEVKKIIIKLASILKSKKKIKEIIKKELKQCKQDFGNQRRTKVLARQVQEITLEDLIAQEPAVVTLTQKSFIKRLKPSVLRVQKRGGKGVIGQKTTGDDIVEHLLFAQTRDNLLFFTDSGKVFKTRVFEIPEAERTARGKSLLNFLEISSDEKILALIPQTKQDSEQGYLVMVTKNGIIKKTKISDFENVRKNGLIAIKLKTGDLLRKVSKSKGQDQIILITKKGKSIRIKEKDIRPMGRTAAGVKGIRLGKGDEIIGMEIIEKTLIAKQLQGAKATGSKISKEKDYLLVITENGYGKRTDLKEYRSQKRGGKGIKTANITKKTGEIVASKLLKGGEEHLIAISQQGQVIKIKVSGISKIGRATQGVRIMRLDKDDKVASIAVI